MKYLLIKDDLGTYHYLMVSEKEFNKRNERSGWMVKHFGTNSSEYVYSEDDYYLYSFMSFKTLSDYES